MNFGSGSLTFTQTPERISETTLQGHSRWDYVVRLTPYDPRWQKLADQWLPKLEALVGPDDGKAEVIGSRLIPGMLSKPTLDIMTHAGNADTGRYYEDLAKLGFGSIQLLDELARSHVLFRFYGEDGYPCINLHLVSQKYWQAAPERVLHGLLVRNPDLATSYSAAKSFLVRLHAGDAEAYGSAKSEFISWALSCAE